MTRIIIINIIIITTIITKSSLPFPIAKDVYLLP